MSYPSFDDLPYNKRPDLTPYLLHLTKNSKEDDDLSAFQNLVSILKTGRVFGSDTKKGFIIGPNEAACFMDVPFSSLKYVLTPENTDPKKPRYEPLGVAVTKGYAYDKGCRPVLYLSKAETKALGIPKEELWRVVRHERNIEGWISWVHEREWRCKDEFKLPKTIHCRDRAGYARSQGTAGTTQRRAQEVQVHAVIDPAGQRHLPGTAEMIWCSAF